MQLWSQNLQQFVREMRPFLRVLSPLSLVPVQCPDHLRQSCNIFLRRPARRLQHGEFTICTPFTHAIQPTWVCTDVVPGRRKLLPLRAPSYHSRAGGFPKAGIHIPHTGPNVTHDVPTGQHASEGVGALAEKL